MARQIPANGNNGLVKTIADDLDRPGHPWWRTATWRRVQTEHPDEPAVQVLVAFVDELRTGSDPVWLTGGTTGTDAVRMAAEWLEAGMSPTEVGPWLRAGCWSPDVAGQLGEAGLLPQDFIDGDEPLIHDVETLAPAPLLEYIIDRTVTIEEAAAIVTARRESGG